MFSRLCPDCRGHLRRTRRKIFSSVKRRKVRLWHCRGCGRWEEGN